MKKIICVECLSSKVKKNGHTYYGKQNYQCLECLRQFVEHSQHVSKEKKELINKLLLERIALRGICRVTGVSLTWLLGYIVTVYQNLPDNLNAEEVGDYEKVCIWKFEAQADEVWSFVGSKANRQWIWIALDAETKQVIAFHVGDHSEQSARKLWEKIPATYRENAQFSTDLWDAYNKVIPQNQHIPCPKGSGLTNAIERFNCTLRQRVSRLVRESLSFSKILDNHIGAIKYFICGYNLEIASRFS